MPWLFVTINGGPHDLPDELSEDSGSDAEGIDFPSSRIARSLPQTKVRALPQSKVRGIVTAKYKEMNQTLKHMVGKVVGVDDLSMYRWRKFGICIAGNKCASSDQMHSRSGHGQSKNSFHSYYENFEEGDGKIGRYITGLPETDIRFLEVAPSLPKSTRKLVAATVVEVRPRGQPKKEQYTYERVLREAVYEQYSILPGKLISRSHMDLLEVCICSLVYHYEMLTEYAGDDGVVCSELLRTPLFSNGRVVEEDGDYVDRTWCELLKPGVRCFNGTDDDFFDEYFYGQVQ